jgi:hypothetical protein
VAVDALCETGRAQAILAAVKQERPE